MKSVCKTTGILGLPLGMALMVAPAGPVTAQETQDSSRVRPMVTDSTGYSDSLVRPGYRAMLEDTTGGLGAGIGSDSDRIGSSGDTATETGGVGGVDTTGIPGRRSEDSTRSEQ
jgi:hypothetical protein